MELGPKREVVSNRVFCLAICLVKIGKPSCDNGFAIGKSR